MNLDNLMMLINLKRLHRKFVEQFFRKTQGVPIKRAPDTYVSPHKPTTVLSHNHFFEIKNLPEDKAPLYMKTETDILSILKSL